MWDGEQLGCKASSEFIYLERRRDLQEMIFLCSTEANWHYAPLERPMFLVCMYTGVPWDYSRTNCMIIHILKSLPFVLLKRDTCDLVMAKHCCTYVTTQLAMCRCAVCASKEEEETWTTCVVCPRLQACMWCNCVSCSIDRRCLTPFQ